MDIEEALKLVVLYHTSNDHNVGFVIVSHRPGTTPPKIREAWNVIRGSLLMPTIPKRNS